MLKWRFLVCSLLWRCGDGSFFFHTPIRWWILNYIPFTICNQTWVWGQLDTPQYVILKSVVPGIFHGLTMSHPHVLTSVTGVADHNSTNIFQSRAPTMGMPTLIFFRQPGLQLFGCVWTWGYGIPTIHGSFHGNMMIVHHLIHWILGYALVQIQKFYSAQTDTLFSMFIFQVPVV